MNTVIETVALGVTHDTLMVAGEQIPAATSFGLRDCPTRAGKEARRVAALYRGARAGGGRSTRRARAPRVHVDGDRIFIRDGNIWTPAGMSSAIDPTLALIEDDRDWIRRALLRSFGQPPASLKRASG